MLVGQVSFESAFGERLFTLEMSVRFNSKFNNLTLILQHYTQAVTNLNLLLTFN